MDKHTKERGTSRFVKRFILCGLEQSGRSTIRSTVIKGEELRKIEEKNVALSYFQWQLTKDYNSPTISFMELGGKWKALKSFINNLSPSVYYGIQAVLFVIDVKNKKNYNDAKSFLTLIWNNIQEYSPTTKLFVLLNKIDQFSSADDKQKAINQIKPLFQELMDDEITFYNTTIHDGSVKGALLSIFKETMPEVSNLIEELLTTGISTSVSDSTKQSEESSAKDDQHSPPSPGEIPLPTIPTPTSPTPPADFDNQIDNDQPNLPPSIDIPLPTIPTPPIPVSQAPSNSGSAMDSLDVSSELSDSASEDKLTGEDEILEIFYRIQKDLNLTAVSLMTQDGRFLNNIKENFDEFSETLRIAHNTFETTLQRAPKDLNQLIIQTHDTYAAITQVTETITLVISGVLPHISGISQKLIVFAQEIADHIS